MHIDFVIASYPSVFKGDIVSVLRQVGSELTCPVSVDPVADDTSGRRPEARFGDNRKTAICSPKCVRDRGHLMQFCNSELPQATDKGRRHSSSAKQTLSQLRLVACIESHYHSSE